MGKSSKSPPKSPSILGLRRCHVKTSPVHAVKPATAVKSRSRPGRARAQAALPPKPAAELPLPVHASESSERWAMLKRLFMWPSKMLDDFAEHMLPKNSCEEGKKQLLRKVVADMRECSMSTSFSGVDTPATAWMMIASTLADELGLAARDMPLPLNAYAIEKHTGCQQELLKHPHGAEHVFCDLEEFWEPSIRAKLDDIEDKGLLDSILVPLITSGKAVIRKGWCVRHGCYCQARQSRSRSFVSNVSVVHFV